MQHPSTAKMCKLFSVLLLPSNRTELTFATTQQQHHQQQQQLLLLLLLYWITRLKGCNPIAMLLFNKLYSIINLVYKHSRMKNDWIKLYKLIY